ncbi:endo-1,4-beta-xylanase, partial [Bacillus pumilus]|uniref:endo-1,4-beta-xylanase n=1 Tax=Bacillus pumilus TaxID=1408 RepID=UPI0021B419D9
MLFNEEYADFLVKDFNWGVFENEGKWYGNEGERGKMRYEKGDGMVNFGDGDEVGVRGEGLFWEV